MHQPTARQPRTCTPERLRRCGVALPVLPGRSSPSTMVSKPGWREELPKRGVAPWEERGEPPSNPSARDGPSDSSISLELDRLDTVRVRMGSSLDARLRGGQRQASE